MCKLPKSSNNMCKLLKKSLHRRTIREEEGFRALEIDTVTRRKFLFRVLKINRERVVV